MKNRIFGFLIAGSLYSTIFAQTSDFGLWTSLGAEKDLGKWNVGLFTELRTENNSSGINRWSYQLKADYKIIRQVEIGVSYKFIYHNDVKYNDFQPRQRYMLYIQGKQKFGRFRFSVREKVQRTIKDERDRLKESGLYDNYKINPEWIWRNRLKIAYNIPKFPVNPAFSVETFYQLNNPDGNTFNDIRYKLELNYKLNKNHAFQIFGLYDNEINVNDPLKTFVGGFEYIFSF